MCLRNSKEEKWQHKVIFRNANKSDFTVLFQLYERPYNKAETTERLVKLYLNHYFVKFIEFEGKIIGGAVWFPREDPKLGWAEILDIWIEKDFRRKGLGYNLIRNVLNDIKLYFRSVRHKVRCIILFTSENNVAARRLYEKVGFRRVGCGGYVSKKGERELLYALNL